MARPKPELLLESVDRKTYRSEQVLKADALYAVYYCGAPFNLRSQSQVVSYPGPKYRKTCFPNVGAARNLARRLNKKFNTDQFTVVRLESGTQLPIDPDSQNS